jgi:allantoate deiminase
MIGLAEKVIRCCGHMSTMTEERGRTTRTFLSPPMRDVHAALSAWMRETGMAVRVDAAGNLRGVYGDPEAPRLIIGSHLDTVPDAGAFDGILGVVLGIALVETRPGIAIEVIGFSEEEGVRFGFPFIGSRAFTGTLGDDAKTVEAAIREYGLDPAQLPEARFSPNNVGYLEFHIEQGPVLESLGLPLADCRSHCRPEPLSADLYRKGQPCWYNAHGSASRCAGGRGGMDRSGRACGNHRHGRIAHGGTERR